MSGVTCDLCKNWSVVQWEAFLQNAPIVGTVSHALQALSFPLRLRPFFPLPLILRKPGALRFLLLPPLLQWGGVGPGNRRASLALALVLSPLPTLVVRWERSGVWGARVCSANSVQDGDRSLRATLCPRGRFPSFRQLERCVFPNTRSSGIEKAIEVPVGRGSPPVQGPVLRTVDCPSGLHQGVCSSLCVGSLPRDSASQVPGRLAGPGLLGGRGQKEHSGFALTLSLPRDSDKRDVRSRSLADCKLPLYDRRYWASQDFSCPCTGREISVAGGEISCYLCSPPSALAGAFGAPGFAGEAHSAQSSSNALSAVAFDDALVSQVGSSLTTGAIVPGGVDGSVFVNGTGPSS